MLIRKMKVSGLLSFGREGIDLELKPLNVLIGPNGSGKTNLLETIGLLKASATHLPSPINESGGIKEWLWKGSPPAIKASVDVVIDSSNPDMPIRHAFEILGFNNRVELMDERIENEHAYNLEQDVYFYYRFQHGDPVINDMSYESRGLHREFVSARESILSQMRDPERYPVLEELRLNYQGIRLYRNWSFGPWSPLRRMQSAHLPNDVLTDGGDNLALVLSRTLPYAEREFVEALRKLFEGINSVFITAEGGNVLLFLKEDGERIIPATRLSDGTLHYLCLLAILLDPDPPPFIAIEEPELGLHPDLIPVVAELLIDASKKNSQILVTTHSPTLIDALHEHPEYVVVCDKRNGESVMERLNSDDLKVWLNEYSLSDLWISGEIGGNRW